MPGVKIFNGEFQFIGEYFAEFDDNKQDDGFNIQRAKSNLFDKPELRICHGVFVKYLFDAFHEMYSASTTCLKWAPLTQMEVEDQLVAKKFTYMLSKDQKAGFINFDTYTVFIMSADMHHHLSFKTESFKKEKTQPLLIYLCYIDHSNLPPTISLTKSSEHEDLKFVSSRTIIDKPMFYIPQFAANFFDLDRPSMNAQFSGKRVALLTHGHIYTGHWLLDTLKSSGAIFVEDFESDRIDILMIHRRLLSQLPFIPNLNYLKRTHASFLVFGDRLYLPLHRTKIDPIFPNGGFITFTKEFCLMENAYWDIEMLFSMIQRMRAFVNWTVVLLPDMIKELGLICKDSNNQVLSQRAQKMLFLFSNNCSTTKCCRIMNDDEIYDPTDINLNNIKNHQSTTESGRFREEDIDHDPHQIRFTTTPSTITGINDTQLSLTSTPFQKKVLAMSMIRLQFKWKDLFRHFIVACAQGDDTHSFFHHNYSNSTTTTVDPLSKVSKEDQVPQGHQWLGGVDFMTSYEITELWKLQSKSL